MDLKYSQIQELCEIMNCSATELPGELEENWLLATDSEADEHASELVLDSIWAFRPSFLSGATGIDQEVFEAIRANGRCEDNNNAIIAIIDSTCGITHFVAQAIQTEGRGHFISSYDGEEHEISGNLYLYRLN